MLRGDYGIQFAQDLPTGPYGAIVLAVKHDAIATLGADALRSMLIDVGLLYDLKTVLAMAESDARL